MNRLDPNKNFRKIFSKRLQYYLTMRGLTRMEFVDQVNRMYPSADFKYHTVTSWIKGETFPRIDKMEIVASFFKVSKLDLLEDKEEYKPSETVPLKSLREWRKEHGLSIDEVAKKLNVNKSTISRYENRDIRTIPNNVLSSFAVLYGTTIAKLLNLEKISNHKYQEVDYYEVDTTVEVRVLGKVKAGKIIRAGDPDFETFKVDKSLITPSKDNFILIIDGESMEPRFLDRDYILCVEQPTTTYNGETCVVALEDSIPLLKRIYKYENKIVLKSDNQYFDDIVITGEELQYFRVLGIPKHLIKRSF